MTPPTVEVSGVSMRYPVGRGRSLRALSGVDLRIAPGEVVGLVGESGSGKSTLGRVVSGSEAPSEGTVRMVGTALARVGTGAWRRQRRTVQVVHQDPENALDPRIPVADQVAEPLAIHTRLSRAERRERAGAMLGAVGLAGLADRLPHQLSGGQMQRAVIARALVGEPALVVCDEPVSALDVSVQAQVLNLLKALHDRLGTAVLFISHDLDVVRFMSDRIAVMYLGRIVESGPADAVFAAPRHPYTRALLAAIPVAFPWDRQDRSNLSGEPPSPVDPPPGCPFNPRCPLATDACVRAMPAWDTTDGHGVACFHWKTLAETPA